MNYDVLKRRAQRTIFGKKGYAEAKRKTWLATRAETEEQLMHEWRVDQAHRTKAPGTIAIARLRKAMAEKLLEVRDLLDLEVIWHVTPPMAEREDMLNTMDRLVKELPALAPGPDEPQPDCTELLADAKSRGQAFLADIPPEVPAPAPPPEPPGALRRALNWLSGGK